MEQTKMIASEILLAVNFNDIHILFQKYSTLEVENNWSHQRGGGKHSEGGRQKITWK
jgi:hypothetical protein